MTEIFGGKQRAPHVRYGWRTMSIGSWSLILVCFQINFTTHFIKCSIRGSIVHCLRGSSKLPSNITFFGDEIGTVPPLERYLHALVMYICSKIPMILFCYENSPMLREFCMAKTYLNTRLLNILANFCCLQTSWKFRETFVDIHHISHESYSSPSPFSEFLYHLANMRHFSQPRPQRPVFSCVLGVFVLQTNKPSGNRTFFDHLQKGHSGVFVGHIA